MMSRIEWRLAELGLSLPVPWSLPVGTLTGSQLVRVHEARIFIGGHVPLDRQGQVCGPFGKVGTEVSLEQAQEAARRTLLAILASLKAHLGSLDCVLGVSLGLLAAAGTIWVGLLHVEHPDTSGDLLALVLSIWAVGWALGPTLMGSEDSSLRSELFRLFPLSVRQLAIGLAGAALVGAPAAVSLLAFISLLVYAIPFGIVPVLIALPAAVLQLVFVMLLCRVVTSLLRQLITSQLTAALVALLTAALHAWYVTGWALLVPAGSLSTGFSPGASLLLHLLPSSWGIVAIDSAYFERWLLVLAALIGQGVVLVILWVLWTRAGPSPNDQGPISFALSP